MKKTGRTREVKIQLKAISLKLGENVGFKEQMITPKY